MAGSLTIHRKAVAFAAAAAALAGCSEGFDLPFGSGPAPEVTAAATSPGEVVERDVEAPDVFQVTEAGLWDGRPSLGGVWVAHPDVTEPERVLIENTTSGETVIGALFKRERENPGPRIQVSSDAAADLKMLAGQPTELTVTALRREVIETPAPLDEPLPPVAPIETAALDDPIAAAAAAIDEAETAPAIMPASAPAAEEAARAPVRPGGPPESALEKPFIQIGIFSIEGNANNTGASLRNAGIIPTVLRQQSQGKTFWRVIVGPTTSTTERADVLARVKDLGFSDAYFVTN